MARDGYQVEAASCAADGLEFLAKQPFDCVLVDLVMPDMDGIEVCRRISQTWRTIDNPIVVLMLTAHETKEDMTRGLSAGADDFVGKSSDMAVLKARIQVLLRRKFFQEENRRIVEELKNKELEAVRSRAEKEVAESRAALAEKLAQTNRELEETNRTLKQTQTHLIQSEKMVSLGQLVAGIAHEINNPLAFVLNNVFVVRESLSRVAPACQGSDDSFARLATIRARMDDVQEGAERVRDLVSKLRTFSRLDEGEFKTVNIHESIDSVLLFLRHRLEHRIQIEMSYCEVHMLSCFAGELNQVLMNIVANAIDSITGAGKIKITTRQDGGHFRISVRDSGKGIPQDIQHRIFEPFFTTKPVGEGTGLGLAISYGIMKAHHGSIECVSEEGKGTEMIVSVPTEVKESTEYDPARNSTVGSRR